MGVRGLRTYLRDKNNRGELSAQLRVKNGGSGGTILVDGFGLLMEMIHRYTHADKDTLEAYHTHNIPPCLDCELIGGDLLVLQKKIGQFVRTFKSHYNVSLILLLDSDNCCPTTEAQRLLNQHRETIKDGRRSSRDQDFANLLRYCDGEGDERPDYDRFNKRFRFIPPLAQLAARRAFEMCGASVINVNGEVDACIKRFYVEAENPLFVLTSDADLVLTPGLRVVFIQDFYIDNLFKRSLSTLQYYYYTCDALCAKLQCTPEQAAQTAVMIAEKLVPGNNFFDVVDGMTNGSLASIVDTINKSALYSAMQNQFLGLSEEVGEARRDIPRRLLSLAAEGRIWLDGELFYLPVFRKLLLITASILGRQSVTIRNATDPQVTEQLPVKEQLLPHEHWPKLKAPEKLTKLSKVCLSIAQDAWDPMQDWKRFWSNEDQLMAVIVLSTARSGLNQQGGTREANHRDLRALVAMVTISSAMANPQLLPSMMTILKALSCYVDTVMHRSFFLLEQRPEGRLMEVSRLYAESYQHVSDLFQLVGCVATYEKNAWVWAFTNPAAAQSATALRCMSILYNMQKKDTEICAFVMDQLRAAADMELWATLQRRMRQLLERVGEVGS